MNERELALYVLIDVLSEKAYNNLALNLCLNKNKNLSKVQRAFITQLVNGTLRNLIYIDYVIESYSSTPIRKMKPVILNTLRISVFQLVFMEKVPASAVVNEAVNLVKKKGFKSLSGFINGVLRNIDRNKNNIKLPDKNKETVRFLSIKYSYPEWILNYWLEEMTIEELEKMLIECMKTPEISVCVNTLKTDKQSLKAILAADNVSLGEGRFLKDCLRISKSGNFSATEAFNDGLFFVMDESAMLSVILLNPSEGSRVIDCCAAPGGKSFYSAIRMNNKGSISARDMYEHKIELLNEGKERLGASIVEPLLLDATENVAKDEQSCDYLIVDAPCSGLGLVKKKPDIKYSKEIEDIESLAQLQRDILSVNQSYVKKGGVLVYSTCTVSKKENIDNVKWFVENYPFELEDISDLLPEKIECSTAKEGYIQILPSDYGTDGFFIAKLRRK